MLEFRDCPVVDNHSHVLEPEKCVLEPIGLAREFFHGMADLPTPGVTKPKLWGASTDLQQHMTQLGVVRTAVCQLAKLFDCAPDLESVTDARNRRTREVGLGGYAKQLYDDARIVATVMDSGLPLGDPIFDLTPGRKLRLLQMDPLVRTLLDTCGSFTELLREFQERVERAVREDGFVGIKSHLGELVGFGTPVVERADAERAFAAAKSGDAEQFKQLYVAVWLETMLQCQDLQIPLHIHAGFTGGLWNGPIANTDPFLLVPILRQPRYLATRLVVLHAAYPWIQHAGAMAHAFPHVWVDIGWTTPWISLRIVDCYRELVAMAPMTKLMVGSGGHGSPEIAWLAAKTAKIALGEVFTDIVRLHLMADSDAMHAGRLILYENAARLYHLPAPT